MEVHFYSDIQSQVSDTQLTDVADLSTFVKGKWFGLANSSEAAAASCYVDCQSIWRGTAHNPKEGRHGITITLKGPCLYIKTVRHMAAWANSRKTMWNK